MILRIIYSSLIFSVYSRSLEIKRCRWFTSLRSRNYGCIGYFLYTLPSTSLKQLSLLLLLIKFLELLRNLRWSTASFFANLHLFSLVHLIKLLPYAFFLIHFFSHNSLFLYLFSLFLLLHLIFQLTLVLLFLHLLDFISVQGWFGYNCITRLSRSYKVTKLITQRSSTATFAKLRHEVIFVSIVKI